MSAAGPSQGASYAPLGGVGVHATGTVMITTGGTGGHVFPGLAVAAKLLARGWRVFWLGTRHGMEAKLVRQHGVDFVAASFAGVRGTVVIGHTHHQFDHDFGDLRVVNAGAVGMPYEGEVAAFWTLVEDGEPTFRRTPIDVERAVAETRRSDWPHAQSFVEENLLVAERSPEAQTLFTVSLDTSFGMPPLICA